MVDPLICTDCGQKYFMSASEKVRFLELMKNVQGFQMPKRCPDCRRKRRMERVPQRQQVLPSPAPSTPSVAPPIVEEPQETVPPVSSPPRVIVEASAIEMPSMSQKEEVRFVLATTDFEDLVHGRPVVWQGVRVILADIGFKVMREAIERAEVERAKVHYHKNGST